MQIKVIVGLCLVITVFLIASCVQNENDAIGDELDQAYEAARVAGGELYDNKCAGCHRGFIADAPRLASLKMLSREGIVETLRTGVMAAIGSALSEEQHEQIATFITSNREVESNVVLGKCASSEMDDLTKNSESVIDWGMGLYNHRFLNNKSINASNVDKLKLSWVFAFPYASRARVQPTVVGKTLFTAGQDGTVYALDRSTGCIIWTFKADAEIRSAITLGFDENEKVNRLYFSDFKASVYALDLDTRKLLWKKKVDDHPATTITGSLSIYNGRVYVPISSLEIVSAIDTKYECCTFRGAVAALDTKSGEMIWKTLTIDETPKVAGKNKIGVNIIAPSGAPVWGRPTIDTTRQVLYVGTGENYTRPTTDKSDAIIAMSLDDGSIQWSYQAIPKDAWNGACSIPNHPNCPDDTGPDADFGAPPMLVKHGDKELLIAGQKSGMVHALDPDNNGAVVWKQLIGRGGIMGGVHWGMATDGTTLYIPINDQGTYTINEDKEPSPGLHAINISDGSARWSTIEKDRCKEVPWSCGPGITAAITATPEVIYAGALDGMMKAYSAESGKELWAYDTNKTFESVNGATAYGGTIDSDGPVVVDNQLFTTSGYAKFNEKGGNVLLAFELD